MNKYPVWHLVDQGRGRQHSGREHRTRLGRDHRAAGQAGEGVWSGTQYKANLWHICQQGWPPLPQILKQQHVGMLMTIERYLTVLFFVVDKNGDVCISILHEPGEDKYGYEKPEERWLPIHTVETIMISVISMLADPNGDSPANVDAAVSLPICKLCFSVRV